MLSIRYSKISIPTYLIFNDFNVNTYFPTEYHNKKANK